MPTSDTLSTYNAKRDFRRTREPRGTRERKAGNSFVVQKHAARRLHFDFRLEIDGVLKSWAVTRGPSLDPRDKRLAVRTEDHPLAYGGFEGTIPQGEYGGGTVMLWDHGTWHPVPGKSAKDLKKGHLHFILDGERMKGEWLLVRMKSRPGEKRENWLLRKVDDEFTGGSDDLVRRELTSVETGRTMQEVAQDKEATHSLQDKKGARLDVTLRKAASHSREVAKRKAGPRGGNRVPGFRKPQLATLVDHVPDGSDWFHEIKFDGYRCLVAAAGENVVIYTRSGQDWTEKFAPLRDAFAELDLPPCLIDGEITAPGEDGNPSFSALQEMLKRGHGEQGGKYLDFHAFDLLELDGEDLSARGNLERKERLTGLLSHAKPPIRVADHVIGAGEELLDAMCGARQEGIISKRANGAYQGKRSRNWLKVKCTRRQEFVIVGWQPSKSMGRPFASLLLAQHEGGKLVYKGKVGTGFDSRSLVELASKFAARKRKTPPLDAPRPETRGARWVRADLVAEVAFAEFTAEGRVRHGSFIALRQDKDAKDVTPERVRKPEAGDDPPEIRISHRERVVFPDAGLTKGDLADYYSTVAPIMLPHLSRRPVSLVRCPQGRAKKCFFQKHDSGSFGEHVHHVGIREKSGKTDQYLYVDSAEGVLGCVQMGTIEFHGWACHAEDVEQPDRMIFDLDPDVALDFADVKRAARDLQKHLADIGLVSFAMLSGGKGVHVVVPLRPGHDWETHKDFARRFAEALSTAEPERFVATMSKARRKGRIFIDWLRNQRGATAVVPYSARARSGAPVAAPVTWAELKDIDTPAAFSISNADKLLKRASSVGLQGWGFADQALPEL
ncbi:ATP-dependent DNA ligase [Novosphingobium endophyticum]|uniref:DNA ligase (ATP) n=1 Tax=Novosphingobium endophyticum TaxID=1955250 RepID=A0A916TSB8_9SPHN|nr:DNA ligase D [Novosphingobium endophyticum]GGC00110.1 ATP-dependent DNA ligase [Novosphingobium endophyticum]